MFTKHWKVDLMNKREEDILLALLTERFSSQRALASRTGHSLGLVNRSVRRLKDEGWLDENAAPTEKALRLARERSPKNAVILAAGAGMRMVPINMEYPKGLLEVHGEPLIERLIRQLQEVGVRDICVVVGFLKEKYEYLIDEFGVTLAVNAGYALGNNLRSLYLVRERLSNTYVVPCDIWCAENPFRRYELGSWYMVSGAHDSDSDVRVTRNMELSAATSRRGGNAMVGVAYLTEADAAGVRERMETLCADPKNDHLFWEAALYARDRLILPARVVRAEDVVEINTYEQLRELDAGSDHLHSDSLDAIAVALHCEPREITDIEVLKKGMTNRSFLFRCRGRKYIMRIPGEGTDQLIDRNHEADVYAAIAGRGLCDDVEYIDPATGYKITRFLEGVRTCDPEDVSDLTKCMEKLRAFHDMRLQVDHEFDLFRQIEFYESLWDGAPSAYRDYARTKEAVLALRPYIESHAGEKCLTHIDAVCDNFLFYKTSHGREGLQLTDWEYAGMQDPHVDIAMFCIYAMYDRPRIDRLIDIYFNDQCPPETRIKIYCYIAVCGLLWSNWCEYKRSLGVEFGEYSLGQYRYAKEYSRLARAEMEALDPCTE